MRSSKYDAAILSPIVRSSRSFAEVMRRLGLHPSGGNYRQVSARIRLAGLDTSHFKTRTLSARARAVPRETLEELVSQCTSVAQLLAKLDLPTDGRSHSVLASRLEELAIDTTHLRGQGWSRGETSKTHPSVERVRQSNSYSDEAVFVENSPLFTGKLLVKRLLALGVTYRCDWCGISDWRSRPLVLHLDHVNGISNDNRRENLRLLCPLCRARHKPHYADYVIMPRRPLGSVEHTVLYAA